MRSYELLAELFGLQGGSPKAGQPPKEEPATELSRRSIT
jgi:hypothetical protein